MFRNYFEKRGFPCSPSKYGYTGNVPSTKRLINDLAEKSSMGV
jgi:hypothetical protein